MSQFQINNRPIEKIEQTTNSSDKSFTVPNGKVWFIKTIYVSYTTNSTAGARQLGFQIKNASGTVMDAFQPALSQTASLTYNYSLSPTNPDLVSLRANNFLRTSLPILELAQNYSIRIYDINAITPTGVGENLFCQLTMNESDYR